MILGFELKFQISLLEDIICDKYNKLWFGKLKTHSQVCMQVSIPFFKLNVSKPPIGMQSKWTDTHK